MHLTISGLNTAPMKFKHLWGRYVHGFRPWKHCIGCLVSNTAPQIYPEMTDGSIELQDRLFYLCGVGQERSEKLHPELARKITNVHLAVRPRKGSVAATGSSYGVTFTIQDAQAITIETLSADFQGLPKAHWRCKNFQFGYQMFDVDEVPRVPGEIVQSLRKHWSKVPGLALR
ncbi:hypothetical protein [Granulicella sibirica]|uniref:Uncharacterized protein n=1 Tax=Granulicella sibirica TaxID=2479048 RepID=A0A4V1L6D7_9BACT|nr:hypothetical protein [Granulicella sibirica]RXH58904.1 hypothetical protein GRAN_2214 [Granulicella sibirica]